MDRVYDRDGLATALGAPTGAGDHVVRMLEHLMDGAADHPKGGWALARGDAVWGTFPAPSELRNIHEIGHLEPHPSGPVPWWEKAAGADLATRVRDLLGLGHHQPGAQLIVVRYQRPGGAALRYPTIADAGLSPWFRPAAEKDPCGVTLDLATGGRGMPETVHPNAAAAAYLRRVAPLGQVR